MDTVGLILFYIFPVKFYSQVSIASEKYGVDVALILAMIKTESNFDNNAISKSGAVGLMQIMPQTAMYINNQLYANEEFDLADPNTNIEYGVYYIRFLLSKYVNQDVSLACYNAGERVVLDWIDNGMFGENINLDIIRSGKYNIDINKIPYEETRNYVRRVKARQRIYKLLLTVY